MKVKQNTVVESYRLVAYYVSALINAGIKVDSLIVQKLGLPWESTQESKLAVRQQKREFHSERKKNEIYKARECELKVLRTADTTSAKK